jgi:hypothetical protein
MILSMRHASSERQANLEIHPGCTSVIFCTAGHRDLNVTSTHESRAAMPSLSHDSRNDIISTRLLRTKKMSEILCTYSPSEYPLAPPFSIASQSRNFIQQKHTLILMTTLIALASQLASLVPTASTIPLQICYVLSRLHHRSTA